MKRYHYQFLLFIALLLCSIVSRADVVNDYAVNFDKSISTDDNSFKPAPGWGHIASYGSFGYGWMAEEVYPAYTWTADGGRDGSGALKVGTQTALTHPDYPGTTKSSTDLLVTPKITGASSIYVKKAADKGTVKFYKVTVSSYSGKFVTGSQYTSVAIPELSTDEWVKVDLPQTSGEYVGIYGSDVYFDDFSAESADLVLKKSLKISKVEMLNSDTPDLDADSNLQYSFNVTLQNTGDVDLAKGDEKYSLSLVNYSNSSKVIATQPIEESLAVGEEKTVPFSGTISSSDLLYLSSMTKARVDVKENISGTSEYGGWIEPVAYKPVMTVKMDGTPLKGGESYAWGKVNAATPKSFTLENNGAAPLNITAISLPDGFSTALSAPLTVAAHEVKDMTVTFNPSESGTYGGNVTVAGDGVEAVSFAVSATMLDKEKYYANFEDGKIPAGSYVESSDWKIAESGFAAQGNGYFLKNSTLGADSRFVTPLLEVGDGETLNVDVAKTSYSITSENCYLNVYYSDNRQDWTLVRKINASELSDIRSTATGHYEGQFTTFEISGIPAGKHYLGFGAGYTAIDDIYGFKLSPVAHDVKLVASKLPATGYVNNKYKASVTFNNINTSAETADTYSATLYLKKADSDEAPIAVAAVGVPAIAPGEDKELEFEFTPHEAAKYSAYVEFKALADDYSLQTASVEVNVSEELAYREIQVGEGTSTSYNTPINWYSADNALGGQSDILYKAKMLQDYGIAKGAKITSITYRGVGSFNKDVDFSSLSLDAYVGMVDGTSYTNNENHDGLQLISLVDKQAFTVKNGEELTTTIKFSQPLVWDGEKALRVFTEVSSNGNRQYTKVSYPLDATYKTAGYKTGSQSTFNNANTPIVFVGVETDPMKVSGTVASAGKPVAGAMVSLSHDDVLYRGETDDEGKFSINIIQTDKRYKLTVAADGYLDYEETDSLDVSSGMEKNITLTKKAVSVTGKVLFHAAPVAAAAVTLSSGELSYTATTTDEGVYTFAEVEPGKEYILKIVKEKFNDYTSEPVEITDNESFADIVMTKPNFKIYGQLKWGNTPVKGIVAQISYVGTTGDDLKRGVFTDDEGKFEFTDLDASLVYNFNIVDINGEFENQMEAATIDNGEDAEENFSLTIKPVVVKVAADGYMTYSYKRALDFSATPALKAYAVSAVNDNYTELTELSEVPASTGILIEGAAGEYEVMPVETAAAVESNLLVATTADYTISAENVGKSWSLTTDKGKNVFKSVAGTTVAKGGAYLDCESSASIIYLSQTDGIHSADAVTSDGVLDLTKPMYNLAGQQVDKNYRGVVIQNGKKIKR